MLRSSLLISLAVLALASTARTAEAGLLHAHIDILALTPFFGAETMRIGFADMPELKSGTFVATGATAGGTAGIRLGPIGLGMLFQRTSTSDPTNHDFKLTKLYGQLAINAQYAFVNIPVHFDFGYAYFDGGGRSIRGPGGKIGIAIDLYPNRLLSLGAGADFDFQGFSDGKGLIGGYGGTFTGRVGLHL